VAGGDGQGRDGTRAELGTAPGDRPAGPATRAGGRPTLAEEARGSARERIARGALASIAAKGLDATCDEVADAAGVSRRTVFRHFANHGEILAAGLAELRATMTVGLPGLPTPGTDVEGWLRESAVAMHRLNRQVVGRAFWDFHVDRPGTPPELRAELAVLRTWRYDVAHGYASAAWSVLGGEPPAAPWVIDAFVLQLSAFASNAMTPHDGERAGVSSARILWAVLSAALHDRAPAPGDDPRAAPVG